jgi:hypothetical protein
MKNHCNTAAELLLGEWTFAMRDTARHCETIFLPFTVAVAVVLSQALKLVSSAASTPSSQRHDNRNQHRQTNGDIATGNRR